MTTATITEAEQREQYARTSLESVGYTFDRAMASPVISVFLRNSVIAQRRAAARRAQAGLHVHHCAKAA